MMMTLAFFSGLIGFGSVCAEIACADDGYLVWFSGLIGIARFIGVNCCRKAVCRNESDGHDCQYC